MTTETAEVAYVVRNQQGQVVVMFWGDPTTAAAEAQEWAERRGYTVAQTPVSEIVDAPTIAS